MAQALLHSKIPARMAYVWLDGMPRVVPVWFHWNGEQIVLAGPPNAPKMKVLASGSKIALTIDDKEVENEFVEKVTKWAHSIGINLDRDSEQV